MDKRTILLLLVACFLSIPGMSQPQEEKEGPKTELAATSIVVKGSKVIVYNANGSPLEVFSLTGARVATITIDDNEQTINLSLKKGCYILKVNKVVRKISIR